MNASFLHGSTERQNQKWKLKQQRLPRSVMHIASQIYSWKIRNKIWNALRLQACEKRKTSKTGNRIVDSAEWCSRLVFRGRSRCSHEGRHWVSPQDAKKEFFQWWIQGPCGVRQTDSNVGVENHALQVPGQPKLGCCSDRESLLCSVFPCSKERNTSV